MKKYKTVDEFLNDLDDAKRSQVIKLRDYIKNTAPSLDEHIKWNAPSYALDGEDRITFNVANKQNLVKLVLHMGATRKEDKKAKPVLRDDSGLVEWVSDIRGYITFNDLQMVIDSEHDVKNLITKWLTIN